MPTDPSALTKLWWHGVDITANVISALVSALIVWFFARVFLRWRHDENLRFEIRKLEQEQAFKANAERERRVAEVEARTIELVVKRQQLASAATNVPIFHAHAFVNKELLPWLYQTGLISENRQLVHELEIAFNMLGNLEERCAALPEQIRGIRIPGEDLIRENPSHGKSL